MLYIFKKCVSIFPYREKKHLKEIVQLFFLQQADKCVYQSWVFFVFELSHVFDVLLCIGLSGLGARLDKQSPVSCTHAYVLTVYVCLSIKRRSSFVCCCSAKEVRAPFHNQLQRVNLFVPFNSISVCLSLSCRHTGFDHCRCKWLPYSIHTLLLWILLTKHVLPLPAGFQNGKAYLHGNVLQLCTVR